MRADHAGRGGGAQARDRVRYVHSLTLVCVPSVRAAVVSRRQHRRSEARAPRSSTQRGAVQSESTQGMARAGTKSSSRKAGALNRRRGGSSWRQQLTDPGRVAAVRRGRSPRLCAPCRPGRLPGTPWRRPGALPTGRFMFVGVYPLFRPSSPQTANDGSDPSPHEQGSQTRCAAPSLQELPRGFVRWAAPIDLC